MPRLLSPCFFPPTPLRFAHCASPAILPTPPASAFLKPQALRLKLQVLRLKLQVLRLKPSTSSPKSSSSSPKPSASPRPASLSPHIVLKLIQIRQPPERIGGCILMQDHTSPEHARYTLST
ncbi:hypothetical protein GGX14DRAFT_565646 [Mycena pura]|uniref:Uncharacterized protein n=1 Tax=Mycena pura TaxID=153505 RepID=A0AAD6VIB6_9AGAR|nr:hypothetical protein GGX14DRAFT_565646 [Mycena pura]